MVAESLTCAESMVTVSAADGRRWWSRIGAATHSSSSLYSPSTTAYSWSRTSAIRSRITRWSVTVEGLNVCISCCSRIASISLGGSQATRARPVAVQWIGARDSSLRTAAIDLGLSTRRR